MPPCGIWSRSSLAAWPPVTEQRLLVEEYPGFPIAHCRLRRGQLRRWHYCAFASLAVAAGYFWLGWSCAALMLLSSYAHWQTFLPPQHLVVSTGCRFWMSAWLLVIPGSWGHCYCIYKDEMALREFVRLRRLLLRAAQQPAGDRLDHPAFELV